MESVPFILQCSLQRLEGEPFAIRVISSFLCRALKGAADPQLHDTAAIAIQQSLQSYNCLEQLSESTQEVHNEGLNALDP